jgi:hypothetical protein
VGVKVKGGMYCPVMAQKTGHGVRNTAAVGGIFATGGLSLLGSKVEKWRCPICGGPTIPQATMRANVAIERALSGSKRKAKAKSGGKVGWRCEKNGHQLDRHRTTCPIDGSRAGWYPRYSGILGGARRLDTHARRA